MIPNPFSYVKGKVFQLILRTLIINDDAYAGGK